MAFIHNDIATKQRLRDALNEEGSMGFEHNDIVTVDVMNAAIAAGGGGGGNTIVTNATMEYPYFTLDKTYAEINAVVTDGGFAIVYTGDGDEESGIPADTYWLAISVGQVDAEYVVIVQADNGTMSFSTNTESGYPRMIFD